MSQEHEREREQYTLTGYQIDPGEIPAFLRQLATAIEDDDVAITTLHDSKDIEADQDITRSHTIEYTITNTNKSTTLFDTPLITLTDTGFEPEHNPNPNR